MDLNICTVGILRYHIFVLVLCIHKSYFHGHYTWLHQDCSAFVQGEGSALRGPKRDSVNKGKIECWHCGRVHYKNECPKLRALDAGVQNFNINDCNKEHNLFLANDG
jgi:hypothetical protein